MKSKNLSLPPLFLLRNRALVALAALVLASGSLAGSLVASSADAGVEGSRGSSNSVTLSSNSSADGHAAAIQDGTYHIARIDNAADSDALLLTLQPGDEAKLAQTVQLEMPRQAFGRIQPQVGEQLLAQRRSHGVRFAREGTTEPLFLLMADAVLPELDARPLTP